MLNVGSYLPLYFLVIIGLPVAPSIAMSPSFSPLSPPTLQYIISRVYNCNLDTLTEGKGMDRRGGGGVHCTQKSIENSLVWAGQTKKFVFLFISSLKSTGNFLINIFFGQKLRFFLYSVFLWGGRGGSRRWRMANVYDNFYIWSKLWVFMSKYRLLFACQLKHSSDENLPVRRPKAHTPTWTFSQRTGGRGYELPQICLSWVRIPAHSWIL